MERDDTEAASDVFRVGVKVPPFWPEKPALWFAQIEAQFAISRITEDSDKFYYVISHLDQQHAAVVEDIIMYPPPTDKYQHLKTELVKRLSVLRENKMKQLVKYEEFGDRPTPCRDEVGLQSVLPELLTGLVLGGIMLWKAFDTTEKPSNKHRSMRGHRK